ncbi:class I SAM-dependent DNA methyltransferase [Komagataeibacter kakiaceti JCM 25156]
MLSPSAIWRIADLLRGSVQPAEYGPVILAFTVLRRMEQARARPASMLAAVRQAPDRLAAFEALLARLPAPVRRIMTQLEALPLARRLARAGVLEGVVTHFAALDLAPARYGSEAMAHLFEELVHHFTQSRGTGAHYTPPEVTNLMTDLVFAPDAAGARHDLYDPAAGTGALLGRAADRLRARGVDVRLFGQELNVQSCALCRADLLLRGQKPQNIAQGDTLLADGHRGRRFARMLANPPFGLDWRHIRDAIRAEHAQGSAGRFAAGLPRVSDGSMLFMLHLLAKMRAPRHGGGRVGVVTHAAALCGGGAETGESAIRRYLVEHDLIDTVIALPTDMFINTGIATYVWILDNRKPAARRGRIRLIDASPLWRRTPRGSGEKRREMAGTHLAAITRAYGADGELDIALRENADGAAEALALLPRDLPEGQWPPASAMESQSPDPTGEGDDASLPPTSGWTRRAGFSRIVAGREFLYRSLVVEHPARAGAPARTVFTIPMDLEPQAWFTRMIQPHDPEARLDMTRAAVGCAISFASHFHRPVLPRPLDEITADLQRSMARLVALAAEEEDGVDRDAVP